MTPPNLRSSSIGTEGDNEDVALQRFIVSLMPNADNATDLDFLSGSNTLAGGFITVTDRTWEELRGSCKSVDISGTPAVGGNESQCVATTFRVETSDGMDASVVIGIQPEHMTGVEHLHPDDIRLAAWRVTDFRKPIALARKLVKGHFGTEHEHALLEILDAMDYTLSSENPGERCGYPKPGSLRGYRRVEEWSRAQVPIDQIVLSNLRDHAGCLSRYLLDFGLAEEEATGFGDKARPVVINGLHSLCRILTNHDNDHPRYVHTARLLISEGMEDGLRLAMGVPSRGH